MNLDKLFQPSTTQRNTTTKNKQVTHGAKPPSLRYPYTASQNNFQQDALRSLRPPMARPLTQPTSTHTPPPKHHQKLRPNTFRTTRTSLRHSNKSPTHIDFHQRRTAPFLRTQRLRLCLCLAVLPAFLFLAWIPLLCYILPWPWEELVSRILGHVFY